MSMYDEVGPKKIQIKSTFCLGEHYNVDSFIQLPDGVHIGYEGWFVVYNNHILVTGHNVFDKWGGLLDCGTIISSQNPILPVLEKFRKKLKNKKTK